VCRPRPARWSAGSSSAAAACGGAGRTAAGWSCWPRGYATRTGWRSPRTAGFYVSDNDFEETGDRAIANDPDRIWRIRTADLPYGSTAGIERPVDCAFSPDGRSLYVLDFGVARVQEAGMFSYAHTGVLWRITAG
jgi:hypothetical protein